MPYQLWVKDAAKAEIKRLPGYMRQRIQETVKQLSNQPRPHNSIQMDSPLEDGIEVRRLRIDTWRVIYVVDDEWMEVGVLAVRKRPPYNYADLPELRSGLN